VSVILFAQSFYETGTVTVTSEAAGKPKARLADRDRGPQWEATSTAQQDLDLDNGSAKSATALALVNHNLSGVTVEVYKGSTSPPGALVAALAVNADPFLSVFGGSHTERYWRVRIPAGAAVAKIGELLMGIPRTIAQNPFVRQSAKVTVGNVRRDMSPGGYAHAVRQGVKRIRLPYGWPAMGSADVATLEAAFDEVDQGAKNLLVQDVSGILRWMAWLSTEITPVPIGGGQFEVAIELEEAL
jgi:hypothetical protein